jgi:aminoglycoside phosphotransferase (APT) family kinase protein
MARLEAAAALHEGLEEHPATRAWRRLRPGGVPSEIRVLKAPTRSIRRAIYWLAAAGADGRPVIAKLSPRANAQIEALIYEEFLSPLALPAPAYHGMVDDGGSCCWLFMDYVAGERYKPTHSEHRRLAGRWVARLHGEGECAPASNRLPDRGTDHYLGKLRDARAAIVAQREDALLFRAEASMLQRLAALLTDMASRWSKLEAVCRELPATLVHGDLKKGNLRVDAAGKGTGVIAYDWDTAGWGTPAVDLAQSLHSRPFSVNACLETYRSGRWPALTLTREEVARQATAGTVMRCLNAIHWTTEPLEQTERAEGRTQAPFTRKGSTLPSLQLYLTWLERSWRELEEWTSG